MARFVYGKPTLPNLMGYGNEIIKIIIKIFIIHLLKNVCVCVCVYALKEKSPVQHSRFSLNLIVVAHHSLFKEGNSEQKKYGSSTFFSLNYGTTLMEFLTYL